MGEQQKQRGQALVTNSMEEAKHLAASCLRQDSATLPLFFPGVWDAGPALSLGTEGERRPIAIPALLQLPLWKGWGRGFGPQAAKAQVSQTYSCCCHRCLVGRTRRPCPWKSALGCWRPPAPLGRMLR